MRDPPVLDPVENQSDGEPDNEGERFLLQRPHAYMTNTGAVTDMSSAAVSDGDPLCVR